MAWHLIDHTHITHTALHHILHPSCHAPATCTPLLPQTTHTTSQHIPHHPYTCTIHIPCVSTSHYIHHTLRMSTTPCEYISAPLTLIHMCTIPCEYISLYHTAPCRSHQALHHTRHTTHHSTAHTTPQTTGLKHLQHKLPAVSWPRVKQP